MEEESEGEAGGEQQERVREGRVELQIIVAVWERVEFQNSSGEVAKMVGLADGQESRMRFISPGRCWCQIAGRKSRRGLVTPDGAVSRRSAMVRMAV